MGSSAEDKVWRDMFKPFNVEEEEKRQEEDWGRPEVEGGRVVPFGKYRSKHWGLIKNHWRRLPYDWESRRSRRTGHIYYVNKDPGKIGMK